jgi:hypothetical protein
MLPKIERSSVGPTLTGTIAATSRFPDDSRNLKPTEPVRNQDGKANRESLDVPRRREDRQERIRAHDKKYRTSVHDKTIYVPIS